MRPSQGFGLALSSAGALLLFGWVLYKITEYINFPKIVEAAIILVIVGFVISLASLIYERSQDVKKERFSK